MSNQQEENNTNNNTDSNNSNQNQNPTYYQRKKNWVPGWDNDNILGLVVGGLTAATIGLAFYNFNRPFKDMIDNFINHRNLAYMQNNTPYPPNVNVNPNYPYPNPYGQQIPPQQQQPQEIPVEEPEPEEVEEERVPVRRIQQQDEDVEEEDDGMFYDNELKNRQSALSGKRLKKRITYESPFGAKVGNAGT